jgi:hypothetical protein
MVSFCTLSSSQTVLLTPNDNAQASKHRPEKELHTVRSSRIHFTMWATYTLVDIGSGVERLKPGEANARDAAGSLFLPERRISEA